MRDKNGYVIQVDDQELQVLNVDDKNAQKWFVIQVGDPCSTASISLAAT